MSDHPKFWLSKILAIAVMLLSLILCSCRPTAILFPLESNPTAIPQDTADPAIQAEAAISATPDTLSENSPPVSPSQVPINPGEGVAPPASEPLRFVFPEPGPAPASAWRPPLYPTPWAPTPHDHFYFGRPIAADEINWPLADYRYGGVFFKNEVHTGVDIDAPSGTPVLAAGPGKITWAGYGLYYQQYNPKDPYGLAIAIRHDFGYQGNVLFTVYGHMQKIFVQTGAYVKGGDIIGLVGETGHVTGPHLHLEVRLGKNNYYRSRNPELWMAPPFGWGVLAARVMDANGSLLERHTIKIQSVETDRWWEVKTYGRSTLAINPDPYYRENMVIGDLPAGRYIVWIPFGETTFYKEIQITAGMVSYFTFNGKEGFDLNPPADPKATFVPPDQE